VRTFFQSGSTQTIYQRPLTGEDPEGRAVLVRCLRPHTEFHYDGIVAEEWEVRFEGEEETWPRVVTASAQGCGDLLDTPTRETK
jgi:hypothetical protein